MKKEEERIVRVRGQEHQLLESFPKHDMENAPMNSQQLPE